MPGEAAEFRCLRCGGCCVGLLSLDRGILRGLTLLPEEVGLFPEEAVKPAVGFGRRPHGGGFTVAAYQLTADACMHLADHQCSVYRSRPASCRQFPFSLEPSRGGDAVLGLDLNCPSATRLLDVNTEMAFDGWEAARKLLAIKERVAENPRRAWFYDLGSGGWVRADRLS